MNKNIWYLWILIDKETYSVIQGKKENKGHPKTEEETKILAGLESRCFKRLVIQGLSRGITPAMRGMT